MTTKIENAAQILASMNAAREAVEKLNAEIKAYWVGLGDDLTDAEIEAADDRYEDLYGAEMQRLLEAKREATDEAIRAAAEFAKTAATPAQAADIDAVTEAAVSYKSYKARQRMVALAEVLLANHS